MPFGSSAFSLEPTKIRSGVGAGEQGREVKLNDIELDRGNEDQEKRRDTTEEDANGVELNALAEPDLETSSRPRPSPSFSDTSDPSPRVALLLQLSTYSLLIFITIWGVLARLGLEWIGEFGENTVFMLIWPQMVGCLIMGFVVDRKKGIEKLFPPLFTMLSTGLCGSMTTFSSWMAQVFESLANVDEPTLGRFSAFMNGVSMTIVTLGLSTSALLVGSHVSSFIPSYHRLAPRQKSISPHPPSFYTLSLLAGPLFWISAIILASAGPPEWRSRATFAIAFGPPGTLLRYYLSRRLNPLRPTLPLGTLTANLSAVLIFAIAFVLQRNGSTLESRTSCAALQGIQDGFCGSLSTVSKLVVELQGLSRRDGWRYFAASWIMAQSIFVCVVGSFIWSRGEGTHCDT